MGQNARFYLAYFCEGGEKRTSYVWFRPRRKFLGVRYVFLSEFYALSIWPNLILKFKKLNELERFKVVTEFMSGLGT